MNAIATDLKIGNLVNKNGKIEPITAYELYNLDEFNKGSKVDLRFKDWTYVDLTEAWLLKLDFNSLNLDGGVVECELSIKGVLSFWLGREDERFGGGQYVIDIEYVHQLQNLFFDLTKKELTIQE